MYVKGQSFAYEVALDQSRPERIDESSSVLAGAAAVGSSGQ
jgi:hypothetical protein